MKATTILLLTLAMMAGVSCSSTRPTTQVTPIAPVETLPPRTEVPDLAVVVREVASTQAQNRKLLDKVEETQEQNADLIDNLRALENTGIANKDDLTAVRVQSEDMRDSLLAATDIISEQKDSIVLITEEVRVGALRIAAMEQERDTLRYSLGVANDTIEALTKQNLVIKGEGDSARLSLAESETIIDAERYWKWRFFWAAIGIAVLFAGSWGLYFYRKIQIPI